MTALPKDVGRPNGQPLQVYLDSSDYSVLGDALQNAAHPHAATIARLIELVDSDMIQVRFSGIHVIEVSHIEKSARDAAVRRARCIERLSKGRCFAFFTSLLAREQENFEKGDPLYDGITNDDGSWFPDTSDDVIKSLRSSITDGLRKALKENVNNRHERRGFERMLVKDNKLSPLAAQKLLVPQRDILLKELAEQFPLSERFFKEDLLIHFATGNLSSSELYRELSIVFRDIEKFVGWTYDTRDPEQKTIKWFRNLGKRLKDDVTGMRKLCEPLVGLAHPEKIKSTLDSMVDERLPPLRRTFITKMAEKPDTASIGQLGDLPALDTFVGAIGVYVKNSLKGDRKLLDSDSGDLFHLSHAPYCDVFRADGSTSQIATQVLRPYGTRVVPKLAQLIDTLDAVLQAQAAGLTGAP